MYVIPLYPQPIFHTNPIIHSSILLFILPWLPSIPLPTFPPIPSHFSHLIPLMKVFPAGSRPSGSPSEPKASLAPHGPERLAPPPLHVQEVTLPDTDVFCWYICAFSPNKANPSSSSLSGKALLCQIYSAVPSFYSSTVLECSRNPTLTGRPYFTRRSWFSSLDCFFFFKGARSLNVV